MAGERALPLSLVLALLFVARLRLVADEQAAGFEALVVQLADELKQPAEAVLVGSPARRSTRTSGRTRIRQQLLLSSIAFLFGAEVNAQLEREQKDGRVQEPPARPDWPSVPGARERAAGP